MLGFMDIDRLSRGKYFLTIVWAILLSGVVVASAAFLGRATLNLRAALTDKPDLAIYLLLEDEEIGWTKLLRETDTERDYLAETKDGMKLIKLKKGDEKWYVAVEENLHE